MSEMTNLVTEASPHWSWVETMIWTESMLAALGNGVKGSFLRTTRTFHHERSPMGSEPIPMRKPATGEPCAGEPHARFGGQGGKSLPDPYQMRKNSAIPQL